MRPKAEVSPHRRILVVRCRLAPICPAPALGCDRKLWPARPTPLGLTSVEDHGDSWIPPEALAQLLAEFRAIAADHDEPSAQPPAACSCALMALPSAGSGPRRGTHTALVDPLGITFLAVVLVVSRRSRDRPPPGPGGRETLPQRVPVPWGAEDPKATDADGPASPEWVMSDDSPHPFHGWRPFLLDHPIRPREHRRRDGSRRGPAGVPTQSYREAGVGHQTGFSWRIRRGAGWVQRLATPEARSRPSPSRAMTEARPSWSAGSLSPSGTSWCSKKPGGSIGEMQALHRRVAGVADL
jgi:hypothetical protein